MECKFNYDYSEYSEEDIALYMKNLKKLKNLKIKAKKIDSKIVPKDEFLRRAHEKFGTFYDYSFIKYTKLNDELDIICPIHGLFKQRAVNHVNYKVQYGCKKCSVIEGLKKRKQE